MRFKSLISVNLKQTGSKVVAGSPQIKMMSPPFRRGFSFGAVRWDYHRPQTHFPTE